MTQAEYEAECLDWVNGTYRPLRGTGGYPAWPVAPAVGSDGAACASWNDTTYIPWYDANGNSGSNSPPPGPPRKKKN